jgi:hypothetical protein
MTTTSPPEADERAVPDRPQSRPAEESGLARIAGWCHDHRWWVLILWLVALVGTNVMAQAAGSNFSNNLTGGAQPVQQILNQAFPAQKGSPAPGGHHVHGARHRRLGQDPDGQAGGRPHPAGPRVGGGEPVLAGRRPPDLDATGTSPTSRSSSTSWPVTCPRPPSTR